jgi:hypothetical protein
VSRHLLVSRVFCIIERLQGSAGREEVNGDREMRYSWLWSLALVVALSLAAGAQEAWTDLAKNDSPRNIILIGWDGAQRNHVKDCLEKGELPNLKKLSEDGTMVDIDVRGVTDTKAGWSQILTGYNPEVTGVYSNGRYQPIPKGLTVFERLKEHVGADKFAALAVIGKKQNVDADGPDRIPMKDGEPVTKGKGRKTGKVTKAARAKNAAGKIVTENGEQFLELPGKPFFHTKDALDLWVNGLTKDDRVGTKALTTIDQFKDKPFFLFVHFAEVDTSGHKSGEDSKDYNNALISADRWTGKIMQKLRDLGLYDNTLIYVTADHGFDEDKTTHRNAPYIFLATNDKKVMRNGLRVDIAPTILDRFGLDLTQLKPPLDGHALTKPYDQPPAGAGELTGKAAKKAAKAEARAKKPGAKKQARQTAAG